MVDEFNYIHGINDDYSDWEKELGEACAAYMSRTKYDVAKLNRFYDELTALPEDCSLSDAALWVLRKCFEDRD